jgi:hypothetical protein
MNSFILVVVLLVLGAATGQHALREYLLEEEDVKLIQDLPGTSSITTLHGCFLVPSRAGCTGWKENYCQSEKKVSYGRDCTLHGGRMLRDCQSRGDLVPTETSLTTCGTRVERECQGPCYNCQTNCRPQYERTCWSKHVIKSVERMDRVDGVDYYTEKNVLENVNSCSESRIGDICAPANCRFTSTAEECMHNNQTEIVKLKSRTCELCVQRVTEVVDEDSCMDRFHQDCRERFPVAWTKLCNTNKTDNEAEVEEENRVEDTLVAEEPQPAAGNIGSSSIENALNSRLFGRSAGHLTRDAFATIDTMQF